MSKGKYVRWPPLWVTLVATCAFWSSGCGSPSGVDATVWPQANVILISIDTLRADHLSLYGYSRQTSPRLDELAARSFVFDRAYAPSANTLVSHASLLTSLHPVSHGTRSPDVPLDEAVTTLAESLRARGYQTAGFTSHPTWLTKRMGFAQGFDYFESTGVPAEKLNQNILYWLRSISIYFSIRSHLYED